MKEQTKYIRPYKWSSWDTELFSKDGKKVYVFSEQKWAEIGITDDYSLVPLEYHHAFTGIDPRQFMMNADKEDDIVFVIDGDSYTDSADDSHESVEFFGDKELETEFDRVSEEMTKEDDFTPMAHNVLERMGFNAYEGYHIVKFNQRELGK
jgi:hypothetical protein